MFKLIAWLAVVALAALVSGCGSVDVEAVDAAPDLTVTSHDGGEAPKGSMGDVRDALPEAAPDVKACAAASSVPYCGSCRDSRGVCFCGALPCCDQHCQS